MLKLRLWLDDVRPAPILDSWMVAKNYQEAITLIDKYTFFLCSLDHDLGEEKDGADVLQYMIDNDKVPELVLIHSKNPVGVAEMNRMLNRYWDK